MTNITSRTETITPEKAREYLSRNGRNRPIRKSQVNTLSQEMAAGRWMPNGEPIIFDEKDNLVDGQHRLSACAKSGASFTTLVVRGVSESAIDTINTGRSRSGADVLGLNGVTNSGLTAAHVRWLVTYALGSAYNIHGAAGIIIPASLMPDLYTSLPQESHAAIRLTAGSKNFRRFMTPATASGVAALLMIASAGSNAGTAFLDRVFKAEMLSPRTPEYALHQGLVANASKALARNRFSQSSLAQMVIRSWNAHVMDEELVTCRPGGQKSLCPLTMDDPRIAVTREYLLGYCSDDFRCLVGQIGESRRTILAEYKAKNKQAQ